MDQSPLSHFRMFATGVDVLGVVAQLDAQPNLWGSDDYRTSHINSPHHGVPDIWLRWRDAAELTDKASYQEPHFPVFWPAWYALPALHPIVRNLSHVVSSTTLGAIFITRVPPGERVKPHIDKGWHASFYDMKLYLTLKANPLCLNWVEDEPFNPRAGDVFEFSNSKMHSVINNGSTDRVTAIICFRTT